jgi:hypothetical protein
MKPPVFICGLARSGTTLLVRLLDAHPELNVLAEETYFYHHMLESSRFSWLIVQISEFAGLPHLPAILASPILRRLALRGDHPVTLTDENQYCIEKTPSNERFTAINERLFSNTARYVHIIRDPRDIAASLFTRRNETAPERGDSLARICYLWGVSVGHCSSALAHIPDRYYPLRYEDLVRNPREVMHGVCNFLGIDFDDRVLNPTRLGRAIPLNSSYSMMDRETRVVTTQIGRFREVLTPAESGFIETVLHHQMIACGYPSSMNGALTSLPNSGLSWKSRMQLARVRRLQRDFERKHLAICNAG